MDHKILLPKLPVKLLACKNLLESFGYVFKDEIPPVFRHNEEMELDLQLELQPTFKLFDSNPITAHKMYLS